MRDRRRWGLFLTLGLAALLLIAGTAAPAAAVEVGEKAPNFTLPSTTGEEISLSSYLGKKNVIIAFIPAAFGQL